jgi:hypothetical protein
MKKNIFRRRRVVMATIGSLGDLHPYIALALEMRKRYVEPGADLLVTHPIVLAGPLVAQFLSREHQGREAIEQTRRAARRQ